MATGWPAGERNSWHGPDKSAIRKKTLGGNDDGKTDGRAGQSGGVRPPICPAQRRRTFWPGLEPGGSVPQAALYPHRYRAGEQRAG